ncbi:MAG: glycosyltransferase [Nocardioides sp.]|uniref:glycosyltransferase n=1 Tax=Nocardioides sp. TaxID=35761 RepID=UPI0039E3A60A
MRVAVVVPVYRNAATLEPLAARLGLALADRDWVLRLVIDACPDGSAAMAHRLAATDARIQVTELADNVGQHRAIALGLHEEALAEVWVCLDADLQDPPEALPSLVARLTGEPWTAGVFAGRRGDYESRGRHLTGDLHRRLLASITGLPADAGAFLAMDRRLRDAVVAGVRDDGAPSVVLAAGLSGLPLASVPVERHVRPVGVSAWTSGARLRQSLRTLGWAARHRLRTSTLATFLLIGGLGTLAYLLAYELLRIAMPAQPANVTSRIVIAVATTWLNARHAFGVRISVARVIYGSLVLMLAVMAVASAFLAVEQSLRGPSDQLAELVTLCAATVVGTVLRFELMRRWLFRIPALSTP